MQDIKDKLTADIADIEWRDLIPHSQRDAVIVVTPPLKLVEVGVAIATDNTQLVQHWISEDLIHKPSAQQLSQWNAQPNIQFRTLIVQPFVLVAIVQK
ncbi:MAG: DUF2288 domain-containing protein [Acaryochloridaceae cyanobacterium CSU_3_4]|nr:DUF2288 domain-containing protein [Acaryochloris sp. SU_5_25]NJN38533.1 DUF2288 domain-containing protein [Acaryochloridaceae cyanobacterium CSU_3_4]